MIGIHLRILTSDTNFCICHKQPIAVCLSLIYCISVHIENNCHWSCLALNRDKDTEIESITLINIFLVIKIMQSGEFLL